MIAASNDIVIVDYGMGNLGSIRSMLRYIGVDAPITSNRKRIAKADKLIFSGVGAFDAAMDALSEHGLKDLLSCRALAERIPVLGICLGMQLLTESSEEGVRPGLGWVPARTCRFTFESGGARLRIPHMGWNQAFPKKESPLIEGLADDARFYFVHSYHVVCDDRRDVLLETHYGYSFCSALQRDNIYGCQFHPEKSHRFGLRLLRNFVEI